VRGVQARLTGGIGHSACIILNKPWPLKVKKYPHTYISWWPADSKSGFMKRGEGHAHTFGLDVRSELGEGALRHLRDGDAPLLGQVDLNDHRDSTIYGDGQATAFEGITAGQYGEAFGKQPDTISEIEGLDEDAMIAWWYSFLQGENRKQIDGETGDYQLVSKSRNCAAMVIRALVAGKATDISRKPMAAISYHPTQVQSWAGNLSTATVRNPNRIRLDIQNTVPDRAQWNTMIYSFFDRSNPTNLGQNIINEISSQVDNIIDIPTSGALVQQIEIRKKIFELIGSYLRTDQHGTKTDAVTRLAKILKLNLDKKENMAFKLNFTGETPIMTAQEAKEQQWAARLAANPALAAFWGANGRP
jgi:hypothetical protein